MGLHAEVIAIGPYSKAIEKHLGYPKSFFETTRNGAIVNTTLFGIVEGTRIGQQFAACLGITDCLDFNQHKIDNVKININALREFVKEFPDYKEDAESLIALMKNGFEFHFSPNS